MKTKNIFLILFALLLITGCSKSENNLTISAAASLTDILEELKDEYIKLNPNIEIDFNFDSSGTLASQIEEAAPVDIFISASEKHMNILEEKEIILKDSRENLLNNRLVLITQADRETNITDVKDLLNKDVNTMAIGDPDYVPAGEYSDEVFNNLNIKADLDGKLVLANNVRTALNWVANNEADYGLVYLSDALLNEDVKIILEVDNNLHKTINYPIAIIKNSENIDEAKKFIKFLNSDESKKTFEKYGFKVN